MSEVLRVDGLTHHYGERRVLDGVTFRVAPGEVVALVGPSGAGKTTLFRSITRLVRPDAGTVTVDGHELTALEGRDLRRARCDTAMIFQQYNLVRRLSAVDNVVVGRLRDLPAWRAALRRPGRAERDRALACLRRVDMAEFASKRADRLSGGQQQRVAIARALAQRTKVVLADEPVSSLDPAAAANVLAALRSIADHEGIAVLCSLHQVDMVAAFADRVLVLRDGRLACDVAAGDFAAEHRDLAFARPDQEATLDQVR